MRLQSRHQQGWDLTWSLRSPSELTDCWKNAVPCSCRTQALYLSRLPAVPCYMAPSRAFASWQLTSSGQQEGLSGACSPDGILHMYVLTWPWEWIEAGHRSYLHPRGQGDAWVQHGSLHSTYCAMEVLKWVFLLVLEPSTLLQQCLFHPAPSLSSLRKGATAFPGQQPPISAGLSNCPNLPPSRDLNLPCQFCRTLPAAASAANEYLMECCHLLEFSKSDLCCLEGWLRSLRKKTRPCSRL